MNLLNRRSVLVTAGLLALLAGLVANFPARVALAWFAPPAIQAWGVDGTIWHGRVTELALDERPLGGLSWTARPARLLTLRPTWEFSMRRPDGYVRGAVGFSLLGQRQYLDDLEASLSLATLPPAIVPIGVSGELRLSLQRLELVNGWPKTLTGRAAVAELQLPGVIMPLGPFSFNFPAQPGPPVGEIVSTGGPLAVDGSIELPAPNRWHFSAELAPGENPPRELVDGLAFVGEDLGGGRRRLVLSSEP
ncbi:MAG: type II secretion system protein N [Gammaproteobacteria bacterium]